ncbi:hypothetical protein U4K73_25795, partial [Klebsiella pneumoniae]|nr:hypothetical protein [Klebsiella pneumoniae]
ILNNANHYQASFCDIVPKKRYWPADKSVGGVSDQQPTVVVPATPWKPQTGVNLSDYREL